MAPVIGFRDTHFVALTVKHFNADSDSNQTVAILEMGMNGLRETFMNQLTGKRVREVPQLNSITRRGVHSIESTMNAVSPSAHPEFSENYFGSSNVNTPTLIAKVQSNSGGISLYH